MIFILITIIKIKARGLTASVSLEARLSLRLDILPIAKGGYPDVIEASHASP